MDRIHRITNKWHLLLLMSTMTISMDALAGPSLYMQHNLVSNGAVTADHIDPNLTNPWGLSFSATSPAWIANQRSGTSTVYDGTGAILPLVVKVPAAREGEVGKPTGIVSNNTTGWVISNNGNSAPASFIFATEDGTISAWASAVDPANAILKVNNSAFDSVYTAMAMAANGQSSNLYVTNFRSGRIEVYDNQFQRVTISPKAFRDFTLPPRYAPFGIRNINGDLYVTYAVQDSKKHHAVKGRGLGIVNAFNANGKFLRRVSTGGQLNAPWGIALAPLNFGSASNQLLIANFGDGKINAYSLTDNSFRGALKDPDGNPIKIDGLWALSFGNGLRNQSTSTLYFTAGPDEGTNGVYGTIQPK